MSSVPFLLRSLNRAPSTRRTRTTLAPISGGEVLDVAPANTVDVTAANEAARRWRRRKDVVVVIARCSIYTCSLRVATVPAGQGNIRRPRESVKSAGRRTRGQAERKGKAP